MLGQAGPHPQWGGTCHRYSRVLGSNPSPGNCSFFCCFFPFLPVCLSVQIYSSPPTDLRPPPPFLQSVDRINRHEYMYRVLGMTYDLRRDDTAQRGTARHDIMRQARHVSQVGRQIGRDRKARPPNAHSAHHYPLPTTHQHHHHHHHYRMTLGYRHNLEW